MKTEATRVSNNPPAHKPSTPAASGHNTGRVVRIARHSIHSADHVDKTRRHPWETRFHLDAELASAMFQKFLDKRQEAAVYINRKALSEEYESEMSGREGWWRTYIRETPVPGSYDCNAQSLLYDIERRPNTYRFKSDGRKIDPHPHGKGAVLLPGVYEHKDFLARLDTAPASYNFKTAERNKKDILNFGKKDKDINVSPDAYKVENYLTMSVDRQPSKHGVFKSQSRRFPTTQFRPKEGPAPGNYESHTQSHVVAPTRIVVSSSFKSRTPRFSSSHTKVPGPGAYEKTFQSPQTGVLQKMGRQHGLFFSSGFQV